MAWIVLGKCYCLIWGKLLHKYWLTIIFILFVVFSLMPKPSDQISGNICGSKSWYDYNKYKKLNWLNCLLLFWLLLIHVLALFIWRFILFLFWNLIWLWLWIRLWFFSRIIIFYFSLLFFLSCLFSNQIFLCFFPTLILLLFLYWFFFIWLLRLSLLFRIIIRSVRDDVFWSIFLVTFRARILLSNSTIVMYKMLRLFMAIFKQFINLQILLSTFFNLYHFYI